MKSKPGTFIIEKQALLIDVPGIKKAFQVVHAVNHPVRLRMLQTIAGQGEMQVTALYEKLHLSQGAASMHLKVLRQAGMVTARQEGKKIWYAVCHDRLDRLHQSIQKFLR